MVLVKHVALNGSDLIATRGLALRSFCAFLKIDPIIQDSEVFKINYANVISLFVLSENFVN
jgi:hypothetical protein